MGSLPFSIFGLSKRIYFLKLMSRNVQHRNLAAYFFKNYSCKSEHIVKSVRTISVSKVKEKENVVVTVVYRNQKFPLSGKLGDSLLDVIKNSSLDIPSYGACDGTLACSTCHVICNQEDFKRLEPATAEEKDMLELAEGAEDTSRLGCQTLLSKDIEGVEFKIPDVIIDLRGTE